MIQAICSLVAALFTAGLLALALRTQRRTRTDADGWKRLRPGWLLNGTIAGGLGATLFLAYILLFVGSARADAESQMRIALLLCAAFAAMTVYLVWSSYGRIIEWKGDMLRVRSGRREQVYRLSHVRELRANDSMGTFRLLFRDGSVLRFSAYFSGALELVADLPVAVSNA